MVFNEAASFEPNDLQVKYKTELCKNWLETGICRYGKKCRFAHGHDEILTNSSSRVQNDKLKTKNCRTFYNEKVCMYGSRCMFRHEHRAYKQIFRHYYVPHLMVLEQMYDQSVDRTAFANNFVAETPRLEIFREISDSEEQMSDDNSVEQELLEAFRSNMHMLKHSSLPKLGFSKFEGTKESATESNSPLNTTQDSSIESEAYVRSGDQEWFSIGTSGDQNSSEISLVDIPA